MSLQSIVGRVLPPVSAAVRTEEAKLTANFVNAIAVAAFIAGVLGPHITAIPDSDLSGWLRAALIGVGATLHLAARLIPRYIGS